VGCLRSPGDLVIPDVAPATIRNLEQTISGFQVRAARAPE
jgi:hypothetical protein